MESLVRHKTLLTLIFIFLFSLSNLAMHSPIEFSIKGIFIAMVSPFQKFFHASYKTVGKLWTGISELNYLREELANTRRKLENFEAISQNLAEIKLENVRLKKLLGYRENAPFKVIPAEVIAKSPDNFFRVVILNKGSSDGVAKYMPVISYQNGEKALVGKVIEVRWNICKVLPIVDGFSKIGGILQNSRYVGLISGNAPIKDYLTMDYIDSNAPFEHNEQVLTSGQGGIFPPGLLIGVVENYEDYIAGGFKKFKVKPIINFGNLEQVLIIDKKIDEGIKAFSREKDY